jgi:3-methyladenine DNA glycosylase AlkC
VEPFKNVFSPALVATIANQLDRHVAGFDRLEFERVIVAELGQRELKARSQLIADQVHLVLPTDHGVRNELIRAMLRPTVDGIAAVDSDDSGISGWGILPLTMVIGQHGLDDFDRSLGLLKDMTNRFSSEFAVRYFLIADQSRALDIMREWVEHPDHHVRRLVSEGTRPRLPWAMRLPQLMDDPSPMFPILEALRDDESEYVRRSVANHLNDVAKDHPDIVGSLAAEWMIDADANRRRLVRHACRTLIKTGHAGGLAAVGLVPPRLSLESLTVLTPVVEYGMELAFVGVLRSTSDDAQLLAVDYVVHFRKSNGRLVGKVFKGRQLTLGPGEVVRFERKHSIRPITTRRYYAGGQGLSLRINGRDFGAATFVLNMTDP